MSNQQLIQLIVVLLIAGSGFLRWLFQKLQEQAAQKRKVEDLERRRMEALRTGHDPGTIVVVDQAQERLARQRQEAARRQAQIEEFRRRQQERARQRTTEARAPARAPAPSRTPVLSRPPPPPVKMSRGTRPPAPQRQAPAPAARPQPQPRPQPKRRSQPSPEPEAQPSAASPGIVALTPIEAPSSSPAGAVLTLAAPPRTAAEWRRAIVVNEILLPPVAERPPQVSSPF